MLGQPLSRTYTDGSVVNVGDIVKYGQSGQKYSVIGSTGDRESQLRIWRIREPIPSSRPIWEECIYPESRDVDLLEKCPFSVRWDTYVMWLRPTLQSLRAGEPSSIEEIRELEKELLSLQVRIIETQNRQTFVQIKLHALNEGVPFEEET